MTGRFDPTEADRRWQARWAEQRCFEADSQSAKPKTYVLEMFPYPSGRIHMGHVRNYTMGDVIARYRRCRATKCFTRWAGTRSACRPRMPRWSAACTRRVDLAEHRHDAAAAEAIGFALDWSREFATCDPEYYWPRAGAVPRPVRRRSGLSQGERGQLGPGRHDRARQRAGDRRPRLALGRAGRAAQARANGSSRSPTSPRSCSRGSTSSTSGPTRSG